MAAFTLISILLLSLTWKSLSFFSTITNSGSRLRSVHIIQLSVSSIETTVLRPLSSPLLYRAGGYSLDSLSKISDCDRNHVVEDRGKMCYPAEFNEEVVIPKSNGAVEALRVQAALRELLPRSLYDAEGGNIRADITEMIELMTELSSSRDCELTCRLNLMAGVRCPKWHEDYVRLRLIKAYFGAGTQWVDPNDLSVRMENNARSSMGMDRTVSDVTKIQKANAGDVLVIAGKNRGEGIPAVLHRSPPVGKTDYRLLFTITEP
jgi:Protein of unknown function (DUF1826)